MIDIDGSFGEGGGQILRSSLSLAMLTGQPFRLRNLRARRARPGLQPQHLMSVQAAASVCAAKLRGASLHSSDLTFEPGPVQPGDYHFKIGTAGATALVLHTLYLPLSLAKGSSDVIIEGGTHVKTSPSYHFLETTWLGYMRLLGLRIDLAMDRPGFYPRGGGVIRAHIEPVDKIQALVLEDLPSVSGAQVLSAVAGLPEHIRRRQADRAARRLRDLGLEVRLKQESWPGGPGTFVGITLATEPVPTLFFGIGERGKPAERVADDAVDQVAQHVAHDPRGVDVHSADQLLLPLTFASAPSRFPVTEISTHLTTNADVIRMFLKREITWEDKHEKQNHVTIAASE